MGTWWEHDGNKGKMKKILPLTPQNLKEKIKVIWVHAEPSHEISISKIGDQQFWKFHWIITHLLKT